ncbi:MAG: RNA polymerase sigma factor [Chloroflexota bacterium]
METSLKRVMPVSQPETDLLQRIAHGDEDALRQLYAAYGQRMFAFALRLTGDSALAEDVTQDSLVAIWQGAGRYRQKSRALTWVLGIVHHKALNAVRGRASVSVETMIEMPDPAPLPDEHASQNEQCRLLQAGLQHLPLEQRSVLELVFYQGLSLEEAAQVCGCPVGTIKSRLNYAKAALRGVLHRAGLSAEDLARP